MKKVLILSLFMSFLFQAKSQNAEVEIYRIKNNSIVKGTVVGNSSDSLRIRVDSLHTLAFAKTELEGREIPVSKEIKKLRRKLLRDENISHYVQFPGIYQMQHGEKVKGKIMFALASIAIIGAVGSLVIFYVVVAANPGFLGLFIGFNHAAFVLFPSLIISESTRIWSTSNQLHRIKKMVNNRYYYRGEVTN
jgi:hypothetical protein